jgi:glutathione S-transferase
MKLYYNPLSPNVRRVRLTAAVLGIELEEKKLDFAKGEHKSPEYLALNPNGAVPTRGRRLRAHGVAGHHAVPCLQEA